MGMAYASTRLVGSKTRLLWKTPWKPVDDGRSLVAAISGGKCVERRTSPAVKWPLISKFLFEALGVVCFRTKLRTSARFLHGLTYWSWFFEPLTPSMFLLEIPCRKVDKTVVPALVLRRHYFNQLSTRRWACCLWTGLLGGGDDTVANGLVVVGLAGRDHITPLVLLLGLDGHCQGSQEVAAVLIGVANEGVFPALQVKPVEAFAPQFDAAIFSLVE